MLNRLLRFFIEQRLVALLLLLAVVAWGLSVAPMDPGVGVLPRDPVPSDAIPDIGENQQIVFTEWMGRSPQDVEDQVTYPLTVSLLGVPGVRTIRSFSYFGFSSIYVIFEEDVEFYWSRSRVLEKLNSLPAGTLPEGVQPALGPDATPLGQVFWYTLEGRDADGEPAGGWDLDELRSVQDWYVRYSLMSVEGVAEVASVGGYEREYQVDVDPDALHAYGIELRQVYDAVRDSNLEVGASVLEINRVEYFLRGRGWVEELDDVGQAVIDSRDGVPVRVKDVATVSMGPALRRGALDKGGAEAVGGVVTVRYGENPLEVIDRVKAKIAEIAPGLPRRTLDDGRSSQITVVPFYDRSGLIHETLDTLDEAIRLEILVTIVVVLVLMAHLRASLLISAMLPVTVLFTFGMMKVFGVDANIVALSGIAIAIGTIVDMGIVLCENIIARRARTGDGTGTTAEEVHAASAEVAGAVFTAVATTIVSFLPVFTMVGAEGKLFKPLAFTKTFALVGAIGVALFLIPPLALLLLRGRVRRGMASRLWTLPAALGALWVLVDAWKPLGPERGMTRNLLFVAVMVGGLLLFFLLVQRLYPHILRWCLRHKVAFLAMPAVLLLVGGSAWLGFHRVFAWMPAGLELVGVERATVHKNPLWSKLRHAFPGFGKEFMPPLDEGSFLYMPSTMPHASIAEALEVNRRVDMAVETIPEVELAVGKIGRAETPLDPAPIAMLETIIHYVPEWGVDEDGNRVRNWRDEIRTSDDIWNEIVRVAKLPGTSSAPMLQPIATRIVMLQSGMRAPMGLKVRAPDLDTLEDAALLFEEHLRDVPGIVPDSVFADRVVGKPYLEIDVDREAAARYELNIRDVHDVIEVALGGRVVTQTVEGRERYPVRVRYQRERRDSIDAIEEVLVPTPDGSHVPLSQIATIEYVRGPQAIKTEDTFLTAYVIFDKKPGRAEVDVVEEARALLADRIDGGEIQLPPGVSFSFAGSYENQVRAARTLSFVLPLALLIIFLILYFHFRSSATTLMVFSGVFVAWAGGFLLLWLYGQPWFLDFEVFGKSMRELFQVHPMNLSVAVWVGFLALFGIATDDGVVMGTYLQQSFRENRPANREEVRAAVVEAGTRRCRPCLMTVATTLLALLPVITSTGRGADVMVPMAIPSFGGMCVVLLTMFVVPVLYSAREERRVRKKPNAKQET